MHNYYVSPRQLSVQKFPEPELCDLWNEAAIFIINNFIIWYTNDFLSDR